MALFDPLLAHLGNRPFGQRLRAALTALAGDPDRYLVAFHAPSGGPDAVAHARAGCRERFGCDLPDALVAFYSDLDGCEVRTCRPLDVVPREQWVVDDLVGDAVLARDLRAVTTMTELLSRPDFESLWDSVGCELESLANVASLRDRSVVRGRHTDPAAHGIAHYAMSELPALPSTLIPSAERLFAVENSELETPLGPLVYFDFFSPDHQIMLGQKGGRLALAQARHGIADARWITESIEVYLKKFLVREDPKRTPEPPVTRAAAAVAPVAALFGAGLGQREFRDWQVILEQAGDPPLKTAAVVRETTGLSLTEAKSIALNAPGLVKGELPEWEAKKIAARLAEVGARVTIRRP